MKKTIYLSLILGFLFLWLQEASSQTLSLREVLKLTKENNLEIKAYEKILTSAQLEKEASKGAYFPILKLEGSFTRTDLPTNVFFYKLNQEKFEEKDFAINNLNHPADYQNFNTKLILELPIWLGGKVQALNQLSQTKVFLTEQEKLRKRDEILFQAYLTYLFIFLSKEAERVADTSISEAEEHLRIAKVKQMAGLALEADVQRAEVYLAKAKESKEIAQNNQYLFKRKLELLTNKNLIPFEIEDLTLCPQIKDNPSLKQITLSQRPDLKALAYEILGVDQERRIILSENLPHLSGFLEYSLNDKTSFFSSSGNGYTLGLILSWRFDTGLTVLKKAEAQTQKRSALLDKYKYLQERILLEIDEALRDYKNALAKLRSAEERIRYAKEVVRVMAKRYEAGLVRMVDLLDAQNQLDLARFERIEAIKDCHEAYAKYLLASSTFEEGI